MARLRKAGVTLLNQSVLLRGVNDSARVLADLSNALFDAGVMPYYLHVLDRVQGAAHFMVTDEEARQIMRELLTLVSGYMVPKLAREIGGEPSKTPLDLQLRQSSFPPNPHRERERQSVRALIDLAIHLAGGRHEAGQHTLRWAAHAVNHVTAHCRSLVTQGIRRTAHRAAFFAMLA
jgi:plasmid stability protein